MAQGFSFCHPAGLAVFRMALGLSVAWFALETLATGSLQANYVQPRIHLSYYGFDWVRPWPGLGTTVHFLVLHLAGLAFACGFFYRVAAPVMFLTFTHAFLMERSLYNNHYYLVSLLSLLATFIPLHAGWSLDAMRARNSPPPLRTWQLWLMRFQLGVVYFFGGIAKLDADWLAGQPVRMWLAAKQNLWLVGPWLSSEGTVQAIVWGGLLIDLLSVPCLLIRQTRLAMFIALTLFHLCNSQLFNIGFFPWLMIPATALFFPPDWPERVLRLPLANNAEAAAAAPSREWSWLHSCGAAAIAIFITVQCLMPFRHWLYPGNPSWTEEGQLFAWRMMLRQKISVVRFYGQDAATGRQGVLDIRPYLNHRQLGVMSRDPDLIVQFAQKLAEWHARNGVPDLEIRAKVYVSLNGRRPQLLINPGVDLTKLSRSGFHHDWIQPLAEPLRHRAWDVPLSQWERVLESQPAPESPTTGPDSVRPLTIHPRQSHSLRS